ncbi:MAG: helix-turn-helix domain-containing protein [Acutalibacteraceae bacterium]|nr:helix-turn-helix domain-containing protein [Acutalibacteraceae bacterium]
MLSENIKYYRKQKGMSQEELALKLNVVRQTVSKWEQNLSVPDSEMLIKLSEVFDVSVSTLLGESISETDTKTELEKISQKLENLNSMMAEKNMRNRRILLTVVAVCLILIATLMLVFAVVFLISLIYVVSPESSVAIIGGADGPTSIAVSSTVSWFDTIVTFIISGLFFSAATLVFKRIKK